MTLFGKIVMGFFVVLIGTGVFFGVTSYVKQDARDSMMQEVAQFQGDEAKLGKDIENKKTFGEFIQGGGSFTCSVTKNLSGIEDKGVLRIHDTLMRVDFSSTTVIVRDGYTYVWNNATSTTKGRKITKIGSNLEEGTSTEQVPESPNYWNNDWVTDYTCDTWLAEDILFTVPKSITFTVE